MARLLFHKERAMPKPRLPMRKIRDVLRLSAAGMSKRKIAVSLGVSATAAGECIRRARRAGLTWPLPDGLSDEALERQLFPPPAVAAKDRRPQPDWAAIHRELRRPGVTLQLLWEEHRAVHPDGYGISRYCELYRAWEARLSPSMRQSHVAGERMFVDYAGTTLAVIDGLTGEVMTAQLFVAVLGASSLTYAEATWAQGLSDWIGSHTRTFAFTGGVPATVVCDNLRSGITRACFYEPAVNRTYAEMAAHYGTTILPARPYRPRDKAKAEVGVQVATRFIIAKLRNRQFFSLTALNAAIAELVMQINDRMSRHLGASRRALFEELERSALKPLPAEPYVFAEWKECRVGLDYHVEIEKHYYSVPHQLLRETVWARITARTIEVLHRGQRVAAHVRSSSNRKHTTVREHMPSSHRRYADWTPERLRRQAGEIGRHASALVEIILQERTHPEQGFRACVGILRLAKSYGRERLEAACSRALEIGARSYSSVNSILKNNLDRQQPATSADGPAIAHDNIRGPTYFH
jgi:transposase